MIKASSLSSFCDENLIKKYAYGHLSRQDRLHIIDSIKSSLPRKIKELENDNLQYFLNLSKNKIEMQNGFADVNCDSIKNLVHQKLNFEKLTKSLSMCESPNKKKSSRKAYLIPKANLDFFDINHAAIELATNPIILSSIANYIGEAPILWNAQILFSPYMSLDRPNRLLNRVRNLRYRGGFDKYQGSQLFHIDADHPHTVKLWVYLSDVTNDSGPLTFIPGHFSDQATYKLGADSSNKQLDKNLKDFINKKKVLTRNTGSVFLIDTGRCLHYGSRDIKSNKERFALVIYYTSLFNEKLFDIKNSEKAKKRVEKFLEKGSSLIIEKLLRYRNYFV